MLPDTAIQEKTQVQKLRKSFSAVSRPTFASNNFACRIFWFWQVDHINAERNLMQQVPARLDAHLAANLFAGEAKATSKLVAQVTTLSETEGDFCIF